MNETAPALSTDAENNGYTAVQTKLATLQRTTEQLMEHAERVAARMRANAETAARVSDLSAAAEVDPVHLAALHDITDAFTQASSGARGLTSAAESMHIAAGLMRTSHEWEYGGIYEAAAASRARQAKPGFYQAT